jgi:hypothetical protein
VAYLIPGTLEALLVGRYLSITSFLSVCHREYHLPVTALARFQHSGFNHFDKISRSPETEAIFQGSPFYFSNYASMLKFYYLGVLSGEAETIAPL